MRFVRSGVTVALALATVALGSAPALPAPVSPGPPKITIETEGPVLSHNGQKYFGTMIVTVRNRGGQATSARMLRIGLPNGLKLISAYPANDCLSFGTPYVDCLTDEYLAPGDVVTYAVIFASGAAPVERARVTDTKLVTIVPAQSDPADGEFAGILRGTTGSVADPVPYTPATTARTVVTAGPAHAEEVKSTTGTPEYAVRIPVTIHAGTDLPNDYAGITISAPPGSGFAQTDPTADFCTPAVCGIPGWMAAGETRQFDVIFTYHPPTVPVTATVGLVANMYSGGVAQPEESPAHNSVEVPLVITS